MRIGTYTLAASLSVKENELYNGKTTVQKVLYFALPPEERRNYYKPYHYGPFSEAVQTAFSSLIKNGLVIYQDNRFDVVSGQKHIEEQESDRVVQRIKKVTTFLKEKSLDTTQPISTLAKVHFLKQGKDLTDSELKDFIRSRGRYFGWRELYQDQISGDQLEIYLSLADELDAALTQG